MFFLFQRLVYIENDKLVKTMQTLMQKYKAANGVNFTIQMRTLNWKEIDARAEAIVNDPSKRDKVSVQKRTKRSLGGI